MVKSKMCINCNRLVTPNDEACKCGGSEFVDVILDFVEAEDAPNPNPDPLTPYPLPWYSNKFLGL